MAIQIEVVYPSTSGFSGTSQLNLGPYNVPSVEHLLRTEVNGKINFQGVALTPTGIEANWQMWGIQWVPAGDPPLDVITSADGPQWTIRQQIGSQETRVVWTPTTNDVQYIAAYPLVGRWAGHQPVYQALDFYMSLRAPTGVSIPDMDLYASLRFWWS